MEEQSLCMHVLHSWKQISVYQTLSHAVMAEITKSSLPPLSLTEAVYSLTHVSSLNMYILKVWFVENKSVKCYLLLCLHTMRQRLCYN